MWFLGVGRQSPAPAGTETPKKRGPGRPRKAD
jgi:hypothetical protein